jgi:hypothetical protein
MKEFLELFAAVEGAAHCERRCSLPRGLEGKQRLQHPPRLYGQDAPAICFAAEVGRSSYS